MWLEIDSQILNALFCVTGLGLVPWRFRDLYYLLRWRLTSEEKHGREAKMYGLRVLAGIHHGWFRLPGSETLDTLSSRDYIASLDKPGPDSPDLNGACLGGGETHSAERDRKQSAAHLREDPAH